LRKVAESDWHGAIFAAAGLERIGLRPDNAIELDWMLPAPAQGAIVVLCREGDDHSYSACREFHDEHTALCTRIERDFLRGLMGGCSTPISALAQTSDGQVYFEGNLLSIDGREKMEIKISLPVDVAEGLGTTAAERLIADGAHRILDTFRVGK
jgi:hydroxymethylbilane synthase